MSDETCTSKNGHCQNFKRSKGTKKMTDTIFFPLGITKEVLGQEIMGFISNLN
jgi:hypothetical protein